MQKQIQIAAKLYECRDSARTLLGANFKNRMAEYGSIIKGFAADKRVDVLQAATEIAKDKQLSPYTAIIVLAAAVELIEPSDNAQVNRPTGHGDEHAK